MTLPATIKPSVGPSIITRATRLFNGTLGDILTELLQNARRAEASIVEIMLDDTEDGATLTLADDGTGIDDPSALLTLGHSGWDAAVAAREDPAGMGLFSLAGRHARVQSFSRTEQRGWEVDIPADGWEGKFSLGIRPAPIARGTRIIIDLPDDWTKAVEGAVRAAASYYPVPVRFNGAPLKQGDFLEGAVRVEDWRGCRIGIFCKTASEPSNSPRINFHGLTVPCPMPLVSEGNSFGKWTARVDIIDAPQLQLVLPARKEMVENAALGDLRRAVEAAVYRAIAAQGDHRLAHKDWLRALDLGVPLPEAAPWLEAWLPMTADSLGREIGGPVRGDAMIIVPAFAADLEQGLACAVGDGKSLGGPLVCGIAAFEGYSWYDGLARLYTLEFGVTKNGNVLRFSEEQPSIPGFVSGPVDALFAEIRIIRSEGEGEVADTHRLPIDMLVCEDEGYDLDEALVLIAEGASIDPLALAWQIEKSLFCYNDDSDSWDTQHRNFEERALHLAYELVLGEEGAALERIRGAVQREIAWLIPADQTLTLTATRADAVLDLRASAS
ncbi:MAG TPA: ATP-binding protein [Sphingobium sp.]|uniref:ATP-binding protein n=1 Tax=Sphingobium sp. TaxID=1912891 RepID=UPI002ED2284E